MADVELLVQSSAQINYIDHHQAGIIALPKALLTTFIDEFERTYQVTRMG